MTWNTGLWLGLARRRQLLDQPLVGQVLVGVGAQRPLFDLGQ